MGANAGWYAQDDGTQRYWDGAQWTNSVAVPTPPPTPPARPGASTRLRWLKSRTAIGVGCGLLGLILGASASSSGDDGGRKADALSAKVSTLRGENADLRKAVAEASTSNDDAVSQQVAAAVQLARQQAVTARKQAVAAAVTKAVARERAKADSRVAQAKRDAAAAAQQSHASSGGGAVGGSGGTDPRFRTCSEANDAGYGPYTEGVDPEYDWYIDRDGDGVVCEP